MRLSIARPVDAAQTPSACPVAPLSMGEFAALMAPLGPFESAPRLAVAVSGGRDSLALALLADGWARARGGQILALVVDHGLRAESAIESAAVADLLRARAMAVETLAWEGDKPSAGVSEAARSARYALLQERCRAHGILHLLLGHQRRDQAETVFLRLADGSGIEGLAGMAPVVERRHLRLLRPLLGIDRARLGATVRACELSWIDDPSNVADRYARVRARTLLDRDCLAALDGAAQGFAADRAAIDRRLARLLADCVTLHPAGYTSIDRASLLALPDEFARRLLGRVAATLGGRHYPVRREAIARMLDGLRRGIGGVAGGCRFLSRARAVVVCREAGAIAAAIDLPLERPVLWDRRFLLDPALLPQAGVVSALGRRGRVRALAEGADGLRGIPPAAAESLPAVWRDGRPVAIGWPDPAANGLPGHGGRPPAGPATVFCWFPAAFAPGIPVAGAPWALVLPPGELI